MKAYTITLTALLALVLGSALTYIYLKEFPDSSPTTTSATATPTPSIAATHTTTASPVPTATGAAGIQVNQPQTLTAIASPLTVKGTATGSWFSEGSFAVKLVDGNGATIGQGTATADGDWMTESSVPFTASLSFTASPTDQGTLVLEGANPSGLPANAKLFSVPVSFK